MRSTMIGAISVGYRLELQMSYNFYQEYHFLTTWVHYISYLVSPILLFVFGQYLVVSRPYSVKHQH